MWLIQHFTVKSLKVFTLSKRILHKYCERMDRAYLRHTKDNERFELTFRYTNVDLKVDREFNFCRNLSEPVSAFLDRVKVNVEKVVNKKRKKKVTDDNTSNPHAVNAALKLNSVEVDGNVICSEIFQTDKSVVLQVLETEYSVLINSPWIESVALPSAILATFPVYPTKFECVYTDRKLSNFSWFKSVDRNTWVIVGNGFVYTPSNADINSYLKLECIPKNEVHKGRAVATVSESTVQASPGACPFEYRHQFTKTRAQNGAFRVVTYNILADLYCDSDFSRQELYPYCPPYALEIDYRKLLIIKELLGYNADIICLQEVDRRVFCNDLEPVFLDLDYGADFSIKGGKVAEGLACFYNTKRFKLLQSTRVILGEQINTNPIYSSIWRRIEQNSKLSERILNRTTAIQTVALQSVEGDEIVLVANTHLYYHPDADHIRLLQIGLIMKHIEEVFSDLQTTYEGKRVSLVFCGDFNSVPECGIYKLFTTGRVSEDCIDYQSKKDEIATDVNLTQPFSLASACGSPKYTNYTAGFSGCLDYIFYDTAKLEVTMVVPMPSDEEVNLYTALPSIVFPSDHIALVSDLKWIV